MSTRIEARAGPCITVREGARAVVARTAMLGGGLKYEVFIETADLVIPAERRCEVTVVEDRTKPRTLRYLRFADATRPAAMQRTPPGPRRLRAADAHERESATREYAIARKAFPELEALGKLPALWAYGLLKTETSAHRRIAFDTGAIRARQR